jgi:exonuclease VII small subunit
MKKIYFILCAFMLLSFSNTFAQVILPPESKPDIEITKDEAVLRIADFKKTNEELNAQLEDLVSKIEKAKTDLETVKAGWEDCEESIRDMLGVMEADVAAFRQRLGKIEGKVRELQRLSDDKLADRQDEVNALADELNKCRLEKIACIPEFYNKIIALAKDIKGLYREKKIKSYTVGVWYETKDCLWNIAGNETIYGDPMLWPKIWQANKGIVKNPDIIHPGQVLTLPEKADKTSDEIKAERRYWRNKKAAQEAAEATSTGGTNP